MYARLQIKFRHDRPEVMEFENRTVKVNLTDELGFGTVLNMTGKDVLKVKGGYVEQIKMGIEQDVWKHVELYEYMRCKSPFQLLNRTTQPYHQPRLNPSI